MATTANSISHFPSDAVESGGYHPDFRCPADGPSQGNNLLLLRACVSIGLVIVLLGASGCAQFEGVQNVIEYNDFVDDFVLGWRGSAWASRSWREREPQFYGHPHLKDFGEGYRQGYRDVAAGGIGCPPALPRRRYWSWRYQTGEGQQKVAAWFEGYPHGARAAEEEGANRWREIQVSASIEAQYSPHFQNPSLHGSGVPAADEPPAYGTPAEVYPEEILRPDAYPANVPPPPGISSPPPEFGPAIEDTSATYTRTEAFAGHAAAVTQAPQAVLPVSYWHSVPTGMSSFLITDRSSFARSADFCVEHHVQRLPGTSHE
jgi:hypothetical protein